MPSFVDQIHNEHINISRILDCLERQIDIFERGEEADFELLGRTLDYLADFPENVHHPKEDYIYEALNIKYRTM